ncbi:MAG: DUF1624 domain-containing protein [Acidobacteria bacterium]|nr:MAG: DUF1624 domain-containing protein [Acidobacteriota bacterium]
MSRHAYLDWVRGVAVLVMVEAHVFDSWTRVEDRARPVFGYAMILGGFGAPLFLFLAGVALVLSAESKHRRTGDFAASWRAAQRRGWQIFGLAFLFRLQSYILSGGYSAASLLKVDILNVMGPAIAFAAMLGALPASRGSRTVSFAAAAAAIALLTPIVRTTGLLDWLPDPIEWYFRPTPGRTNFTLFPWAGFVFAGAVLGEAIDGSRAPDQARRLQVRLALAGLAMALIGYAASFRPSIYARSEFWTSSPTFFLLRAGLLTMLLPFGYVWEHLPLRHKLNSWSPLEEFGRASLFVYWIHVELVYGFFSRPIRRALTFEQTVAAYLLFTVFLLGLVRLKNRLAQPGAIYLTDSKSVI